MAGVTLLGVLAHYGLWASRNDTSVAGAYLAFSSALVVWCWHEMSFLMGFVTGPRRLPSPPESTALQRFGHAVQTVLWHELAILLSAVLVIALTWNGTNQIGTWTFTILWLMRVSAKLNVYLGVPNLNEEFLPEHLHYLRFFLTKKPMNAIFPLSITASTVVATCLVLAAAAEDAGRFEVTGFTFLGVLMALAILEHWFLVLPLPDAALWSWALGSRAKPVPDEIGAGSTGCANTQLPRRAAVSA
jgi:putative photosynthetic complex assembly protein 2